MDLSDAYEQAQEQRRKEQQRQAFQQQEQKLQVTDQQMKSVFDEYQGAMQTVEQDVRIQAAERTYKQPKNFWEKLRTIRKGPHALGVVNIKDEKLTQKRKKKVGEYYSERRKEKEKNFLKDRASKQAENLNEGPLKKALKKQAKGFASGKREDHFASESKQIRELMNDYRKVVSDNNDQDDIAKLNYNLLKKQTGGSLKVDSSIKAQKNYHVCNHKMRKKEELEKKKNQERANRNKLELNRKEQAKREQERRERERREQEEREQEEIARQEREAKSVGDKLKLFNKKCNGFFTSFKNKIVTSAEKTKNKIQDTAIDLKNKFVDSAEDVYDDAVEKFDEVYDKVSSELDDDLGYSDVPEAILFPHAPCVSDISQKYTGDCYLLSAVTSLVQKNPDMLRDMMVDNGDTVTVRLYDREGNKQFFEVTKRLADNGADGPLWVQMIEKAFCYLRLSQMKVTEEEREALAEQIELGETKIADEGATQEAMRALTGIRASQTSFGMRTSKFTKLKKAMLGQQANNLDNETLKELPYSGTYSTEATRVYKTIKEGLEHNSMVTTGTMDFKAISNEFNLSAQQDHNILDGMVGGHAYTILGVETRITESRSKNGQPGAKYEGIFIKLHNPWGKITRELDKDNGAANTDTDSEADSGIIEMELNDFMMYCDHVVVGNTN